MTLWNVVIDFDKKSVLMIETVQIVAITRRLYVLSIAVYVYKTAARDIYTIRQQKYSGNIFIRLDKNVWTVRLTLN